VADPYFGEDSGFDATWADVSEGTEALIANILRK
jgi:protein-tyrosine phosphatase